MISFQRFNEMQCFLNWRNNFLESKRHFHTFANDLWMAFKMAFSFIYAAINTKGVEMNCTVKFSDVNMKLSTFLLTIGFVSLAVWPVWPTYLHTYKRTLINSIEQFIPGTYTHFNRLCHVSFVHWIDKKKVRYIHLIIRTNLQLVFADGWNYCDAIDIWNYYNNVTVALNLTLKH